MEALRSADSAYHKRIMDSVSLAKALGGYLPVRYYMHEAQEGYGRMKCQVLVEGLHAIPFVHMKREVRAHLASAYYWDIDMVNCQPCIFRQKLARVGVASPLLDRYVVEREASLNQVMRTCSVARDEAKNLFIRIIYFGSIDAWCAEFNCREPPSWVYDLQTEIRQNAELLCSLPEIQDLKRYYNRRSLAVDSVNESAPASASLLALYLQTIECKCIRALVDVLHNDGRKVGGIIYDGVHVEKLQGESSVPSASLSRWRNAILRQTDYDVDLAVKPFCKDDAWIDSASDLGAEDIWDERWMSGHVVLTYDEMKQRWECRSFKIVQGGNYIREEKERRVVMSDKVLNESYKHLHYAIVKQNDSGQAFVQLKPFITQWVKDPLIRRYKGLVFRPPPMASAGDTYNIWNGFAVNRYEPAVDRPVDPDGVAVKHLVDFLKTLCGHKQAVLDYLLDWMAQIFQYPSRKTGVAILLKGEEGVGKNRATDILSAMLGPDKSLNTSSPKNTLYGEFTQLREGKFLVVINEANGADNFAANDIIKDMITSDTFVCNAKSQNSYSIECYARFIFTTNNDNCLKVESGSRRYQVINVSSELKGNTDYFKNLSAIIDDPHSRYEFYKYLMDRDIVSRDWINDRPLTESFTEMVSMNLPFEFHFIKDTIMSQDGTINDKLTLTGEELFQQFNAWMQVNVMSEQARSRHNTSSIKFGVTLSKLVASDSNRAGFKSVMKSRKAAGVLYTFDVAGMQREMVEKHWVESGIDVNANVDLFAEVLIGGA
jgi:hypothetical protein